MSDSPQSVGVMLGKGATFGALGKTWKVSAPDQNAKARLEKIVAAEALNEVRRLKGTLDTAAYQEAFSDVTRRLKDYRTWGPGWQATVFGPSSAHFFLWSLLQGAHPDADEQTVLDICQDAPEEVAAVYVQILPDFFSILLEPVRNRIPPDKLAELEAIIASIPDLIRRSTPIRS